MKADDLVALDEKALQSLLEDYLIYLKGKISPNYPVIEIGSVNKREIYSEKQD